MKFPILFASALLAIVACLSPRRRRAFLAASKHGVYEGGRRAGPVGAVVGGVVGGVIGGVEGVLGTDRPLLRGRAGLSHTRHTAEALSPPQPLQTLEVPPRVALLTIAPHRAQAHAQDQGPAPAGPFFFAPRGAASSTA